jgi:polysaccharide pyruvyl transferase WcaK-like protein
MHTFYEGGDDRIFGRKLARAVGIADPSAADPLVPEQHVTPWQIVSAMQSSCLCVCMRFHSVVFASTLSRPFIAIDYTNNGKIAAFLRARNQTDRLVSVQEVCDGSWKDRVGKIVASINET